MQVGWAGKHLLSWNSPKSGFSVNGKITPGKPLGLQHIGQLMQMVAQLQLQLQLQRGLEPCIQVKTQVASCV